MPEPMNITSDDELNDELAAELGALRGSMLARVSAGTDQLVVLPCVDRPAVDIHVLATGQHFIVGLYCASEIVQVLGDLLDELV